MPSSDSELPSLNCISAPNSSSAFVHELRMNVGLVRASLSLHSSLGCVNSYTPILFILLPLSNVQEGNTAAI